MHCDWCLSATNSGNRCDNCADVWIPHGCYGDEWAWPWTMTDKTGTSWQQQQLVNELAWQQDNHSVCTCWKNTLPISLITVPCQNRPFSIRSKQMLQWLAPETTVAVTTLAPRLQTASPKRVDDETGTTWSSLPWIRCIAGSLATIHR